MEVAAAHQLVDRIDAVGDDCTDRGVVLGAIADIRRLQSWCQGRDVRMAKILKGLSSFPEKDHADASGADLRDGARASGQRRRRRHRSWVTVSPTARSPVPMSTSWVMRCVSSNRG